jgi:hypothetical protein
MSEHHLPVVVGPLSAKQIAKKMSSGHSVFSPSGAEMTMTCPESLVINALADDDTNIDSATGTVAHWLAEKWLKTGRRPVKWIGRTRRVKDFDIDITEEMMEYVGDFVRRCQTLADEAEDSFTERQVDISDLTPIPDQGGTLDFGGMGVGWIKIVDLKYGKEPVYAYDPVDEKVNAQLGIYAWAVFLEFDWLYNFQEITLAISQPRLPHSYSEVTISRAELIAFADTVRGKWAHNWANPKGRLPSIKGCRWCAARATCPALYLFMSDRIGGHFRNHDEIEDAEWEEVIPEDTLAGANAVILDQFAPTPFPNLPEPVRLNTKALEKLLRYQKLMDNFFKAIREELLDRAISHEEELTWWKLVMGRSLRKWVDDEDFVVASLGGLGLKPEYVYKTVMLSPAEMERMLHTKLKMPLSKAKKFFADEGLTVQPPGQKSLVQKSDRRKALPKVDDVFRDHTASDTEQG